MSSAATKPAADETSERPIIAVSQSGPRWFWSWWPGFSALVAYNAAGTGYAGSRQEALTAARAAAGTGAREMLSRWASGQERQERLRRRKQQSELNAVTVKAEGRRGQGENINLFPSMEEPIQ